MEQKILNVLNDIPDAFYRYVGEERVDALIAGLKYIDSVRDVCSECRLYPSLDEFSLLDLRDYTTYKKLSEFFSFLKKHSPAIVEREDKEILELHTDAMHLLKRQVSKDPCYFSLIGSSFNTALYKAIAKEQYQAA